MFLRTFSCLVLLCCVFIISAPVQAGQKPLEASQVVAFLDSEKQLLPLAADMEKDGVKSFFKPRPMHLVMQGLPSYQKNVENLKADHPQYYKRMEDVLVGFKKGDTDVPHFSSPEEWAVNSDRVMLTFYAARGDASETGYDDMKARFSPAMMAMMPASAKAQLAPMLDMLKSMQDVSDHDKAVVMQFEEPIGMHLFVTQ